MRALVLAGGRGLRLSPYTQVLPKPLLPVGDRPVLAILLERLRLSGVGKVWIALGYLGDLIRTYFGDGARFDLDLSYLEEPEPTGTAGSLRLLPRQREPFIMVNGDILTDLPFDRLFQAHLAERDAALTVAAHEYGIRIDYGCLRIAGTSLLGWEEKPYWRGTIGIGAYVVDPAAQAVCPPGRVEMPELIRRLLETGRRVAVYHTGAYWRDIGTPEEYAAANQDPPDFAKDGGVFGGVGQRDYSALQSGGVRGGSGGERPEPDLPPQ